MINFLEQPEQFKAVLKDKWLDYYQANRHWLQALMNESGNWYDRVSSYEEEELEQLGYTDYSPSRLDDCFMFGVLSILEPQIKGLFTLVPGSPDTYLKQLDLDFDPEIELKNRSLQQSQQQINTESQYLDKIREEIKT
ncbi:conserved hypothetical protein [Hyella patelloides LEGE 07179]|uniref:Uncharacterized protein n=1 Tax=Hyella patelloides LEGE 07179 TaxID=945734 RepID=A0A563VK08_9CYAN|nr:DUF5331 domain-containing protein [Hyella patelloides]VEP11816.1 conserved hypothetical protein [Hyella patelloides LEGE 07179]